MKWAFAAFAILYLMPLSAEAAYECRHGHDAGASQGMPGDQSAALAESVEKIPASGTAVPCPDHPDQPCTVKAGMMFKCTMEKCGIEADGPLSTGLSDRAPAKDDHALEISIEEYHADGRLMGAAHYRLSPQRNLPEPDPRPPTA